MKKTILIYFLLLLPIFAQAQFGKDTLTPVKGNKFITIGIFHNTGFINYRIYKTDKRSKRFGLVFNYQNASGNTSNKWYKELKNNSNNFSFSFSYGQQYKVIQHNFIEPYVGFDIKAGITYSNTNYEYNYFNNLTSSTTDSLYFQYRQSDVSHFVTANVSFNPVIGCNFYPAKGISIGVEYLFPLLGYTHRIYSNSETKQYDINGNDITKNYIYDTTTSSTTPSINSFTTSFLGSAYITLGFTIGNSKK